jgi:hypothetical protein
MTSIVEEVWRGQPCRVPFLQQVDDMAAASSGRTCHCDLSVRVHRWAPSRWFDERRA